MVDLRPELSGHDVTAHPPAGGPWWRGLNGTHRRVLGASLLGWSLDGFETYALVIVVGPAMAQLLTAGQQAHAALYAGLAIGFTLLGNGVTLLGALSIVKETMGNLVLAASLDGVTAKLREGKGFGRPLAETGLWPRLATQMILVGEESGRLEEMLGRVADVYDREVQVSVKRFLAVLEPALILGLAVLIGGIVFSILLGVMGMSELVG